MKPVLAIVDDDELLQLGLERAFADQFEVRVFGSPRAALAALGAGERTDVLLFDFRMPGMTGETFAERLAEAHPQILARSVLMTGRSLSDLPEHLIDRLDGRVVGKPFDVRGLKAYLLQLSTKPVA